jgi:hypothetical protein
VAVLELRKDRRMSDYLGAPRFRVTELEGYSFASMNPAPGTSFAIIDRAYCCAEVWQDRSVKGMGQATLWARRFRANEKCAELNAKHD